MGVVHVAGGDIFAEGCSRNKEGENDERTRGEMLRQKNLQALFEQISFSVCLINGVTSTVRLLDGLFLSDLLSFARSSIKKEFNFSVL